MSPNDSAITEMEIELPHQHSTAQHRLCCVLSCELVATLVSGSGSGSDELRACLFTLNYPFLLARSQLISRLPAERRQHWARAILLYLLLLVPIGHVLSFQIWRVRE